VRKSNDNLGGHSTVAVNNVIIAASCLPDKKKPLVSEGQKIIPGDDPDGSGQALLSHT
jgi:hypothetical protein